MPIERSVRIQVTGRARAGKTTLRHALSLLAAEETPPLDRPGQPHFALDADLLLYVLPGAVNPVDRRMLAALPPERTLVILNKADSLGTRWSDAALLAARLEDELGHRTFPVVAVLAARTRTTTLTAADLHTLRRQLPRPDPPATLSHDLFTAAGPDSEACQALLDRWDLHGVSCALTALRHHPALTERALGQILHCASGIDPLHTEILRRYGTTPAA
ncbi:hypothetical protein D7D52_21560 [Nocardia yunnanensis]|uniref:G domain-containing protein n=1 Tax=Nocardia yunnanensis TaxID=2382165 RepID=A0A386ZHD5_9NOCA|nr:hypothetical protein [Nocardia yunnanensis]AYF75995.1 hypothetical protein D7D52_21560 [Nocardia yunnanensis]